MKKKGLTQFLCNEIIELGTINSDRVVQFRVKGKIRWPSGRVVPKEFIFSVPTATMHAGGPRAGHEAMLDHLTSEGFYGRVVLWRDEPEASRTECPMCEQKKEIESLRKMLYDARDDAAQERRRSRSRELGRAFVRTLTTRIG